MILNNSPKIELIQADCLPIISALPDKCFDIAIIDPPYGIKEDGRKSKTRGKLWKAKDYKPYSGNDREPPSPEFFTQLFRVSKQQVIFGANHFISRLPEPDSTCWLIWDKLADWSDFADFDLAWTSFNGAARVFRYRWAGFIQGDNKDREVRIHPNQKPAKLYAWILNKFCAPGISVLDTHAGSASLAIACLEFGADYTGIELDPHYYGLAVNRLEAEIAENGLKKRQISIATPPPIQTPLFP